MAPTSYRYSQLSMDEFPENLGDCKLPVRVWILLGLLVVGLTVAVVVLAAQFNSPARKDGLRAEQECRNITHLLEQELTQAQEVLRGTEAQAATCNQTVETLKISLKEKAAGHRQQELMQKLQEEIKPLNQSLQRKSADLQRKSAELQRKTAELEEKSVELEEKSAELEKLRKENEALVSAKGPPDSEVCLILSGAAVFLSPLVLLFCCRGMRACRHILT